MKKKLFVKLITSLLFVAAVIFAGCSNPSSSNGDTQLFSADVSKGSVIKGIYSGDNEGTRIVFDLDGTVEFYDDGSASARAAVAFSEDNVCARGTYVITADNIAKITIEEVLREWGSISQSELEGKTLAVAFSGNDLSITIDKETLSFSYKPSSNSPLFRNGRVNATYLIKATLTLEDGSFTLNIDEETVRGECTQSGNTITFTNPTLIGGDDATKATATISGDTLTLTTVDGSSDKDVLYFKKSGSSGKEWELRWELKLSSNGSITYSENGVIRWNGTYTIINSETASVNVKSGSIKDIFGTDQGNLYIDEADQNSLDLDLIRLNGGGGIAISFSREK